MRLSDSDREWLACCFPDLLFDTSARELTGEVAFYAAYDSNSGQVRIGDDDMHRRLDSFLCDSFRLRIDLDSIDQNGWPRVYEVGSRHTEIAAKHKVEIIDLHFYPNSACCLGIRLSPERLLTLERFMDELVVPFFYRLSYTYKYGIDAARRDLWGEYNHGNEGGLEYMTEVGIMSDIRPGRNDRCPCGSGRKYKRCHLDEVDELNRMVIR